MKVLLLIIVISYSNHVYNPERIEKKLIVNSKEEASFEVYNVEKYLLPSFSVLEGRPVLKSELFEIDVQTLELKKIEIPTITFK